jgi:hypothetical protein
MITVAYPYRVPVSTEHDDALRVILFPQSRPKVAQESREITLWAHAAWHGLACGLSSDEHRRPVPKEESGDFVWSGGE